MTKKLVMNPVGWECTLEECPPGAFLYNNQVCFKSEYSTNNGQIEAYNSAGEFFCGDNNVKVQPLEYEWEIDENIYENLSPIVFTTNYGPTSEGVQIVPPSKQPAPKPPGNQY